MIQNKNDYKDRPEIHYMVTQLEKAIAKQDEFSISVIITRLLSFGISVKPTKGIK